MTTNRTNLLPSGLKLSAQDTENVKLMSSVQEEKEATSEKRKGLPLRQQLLITLLPLTLIPLTVIGGMATKILENEKRADAEESAEKTILLTSSVTSDVLEQALDVNSVLAANPFIINHLKSETQKAVSMGLTQKTIPQLEKQFSSDKLISPSTDVKQYLNILAKKSNIAEIILTESHGYNVAYSSPTSDFVQNDEKWWQSGQQKGATLLAPKFDESSKSAVLEIANSVKDEQTGKLLGVTKVGVSVGLLDQKLEESVKLGIFGTQTLQIIDALSGKALNTVTAKSSTELGEVIGGAPIIEAAKSFAEVLRKGGSQVESNLKALEGQDGINNVQFSQAEIEGKQASLAGVNNILSFEFGDKYFHLTNIPNTDLVVVSAVDKAEIAAQGQKLLNILAITAILLGTAATIAAFWLAKKLSTPLANLASKAQQVAQGDLEVQAELEGAQETQLLADNFNNLVTKVKGLITEQENIAKEKQQQAEVLEQGIYQLLEEVQGALDGDLTVRASLSSMEMSTVADLFNAIVDNLQDIAVKVKDSSTQVSSSLEDNEKLIQDLAQQAIAEAAATRQTLDSVEQMSESIKEVAQNANQAADLAGDTYSLTQESANVMNETVESILNLRSTVGNTAKMMKRLGESSQKISQFMSIIEEIALKTNLLAINAGIEARRAGEFGEGFSVVAEQVGALAAQSSAAAKEIAQIVGDIQVETQEVSHAMEVGTTQVIDGTRLVESTKQRLQAVLERSQTINELMQSISQKSDAQMTTSTTVTKLMQEITQQSEERLASSQQVAKSIHATAQVAHDLESAVEQFKVSEEV